LAPAPIEQHRARVAKLLKSKKAPDDNGKAIAKAAEEVARE
jgi:hypothetical protein